MEPLILAGAHHRGGSEMLTRIMGALGKSPHGVERRKALVHLPHQIRQTMIALRPHNQIDHRLTAHDLFALSLRHAASPVGDGVGAP